MRAECLNHFVGRGGRREDDDTHAGPGPAHFIRERDVRLDRRRRVGDEDVDRGVRSRCSASVSPSQVSMPASAAVRKLADPGQELCPDCPPRARAPRRTPGSELSTCGRLTQPTTVTEYAEGGAEHGERPTRLRAAEYDMVSRRRRTGVSDGADYGPADAGRHKSWRVRPHCAPRSVVGAAAASFLGARRRSSSTRRGRRSRASTTRTARTCRRSTRPSCSATSPHSWFGPKPSLVAGAGCCSRRRC